MEENGEVVEVLVAWIGAAWGGCMAGVYISAGKP